MLIFLRFKYVNTNPPVKVCAKNACQLCDFQVFQFSCVRKFPAAEKCVSRMVKAPFLAYRGSFEPQNVQDDLRIVNASDENENVIEKWVRNLEKLPRGS